MSRPEWGEVAELVHGMEAREVERDIRSQVVVDPAHQPSDLLRLIVQGGTIRLVISTQTPISFMISSALWTGGAFPGLPLGSSPRRLLNPH